MILLVCGMVAAPSVATLWGQPPKKKVARAKPPQFDQKSMEGIYFSDVKKQLIGEPPKATDSIANNGPSKSANIGDATSAPEGAGAKAWAQAISAASLEDLVKGCKLRLDGIVVSQAKFIGGGFNDARREYTLLATLFGVIEQYPTQVRWKDSAAVVRMHMVRVAASSKVGSPQAFTEAKNRLQELTELVGGGSVKDNTPIEEMNWAEAVDRIPLMQVLEWGLRENLIKHCASPKEFQENSEEIVKFAELITAVSEVLLQKGMNDVDDPEYVKFTKAMIAQSQATLQGVKLNSPENAKEATALINQACDNCHNVYR